MHWTFLAPELSATSSIERGWIVAQVALVVSLQLLGHPDHALVARVTVHPLDLHHARLLRGVADHDALPGLAVAHGPLSFLRRGALRRLGPLMQHRLRPREVAPR